MKGVVCLRGRGAVVLGAAFIPFFFNTGNTENEFANTGITGTAGKKPLFF